MMRLNKILSKTDDIKRIREKRSAAKAKDRLENTAIRFYELSKRRSKNANLWSDLYSDKDGKKLHSAIRDILLDRQESNCAYCREKIFHNSEVKIDHIVPRSSHPNFTLTPSNLCATCTTCNAFKSNQNFYLQTSKTGRYKPDTLTCFHPIIHNYHDHIEVFSISNNTIRIRSFVGKTPQGKVLCNKLLSKVSTSEINGRSESIFMKIAQSISTAATNGIIPYSQEIKALEEFIRTNKFP